MRALIISCLTIFFSGCEVGHGKMYPDEEMSKLCAGSYGVLHTKIGFLYAKNFEDGISIQADSGLSMNGLEIMDEKTKRIVGCLRDNGGSDDVEKKAALIVSNEEMFRRVGEAILPSLRTKKFKFRFIVGDHASNVCDFEIEKQKITCP